MKTILIDLDGVLNEYNGKYKAEKIPKIRQDAKKFLLNLSADYDLQLFTTRNKILAVKWLLDNKIDTLFSNVTSEKIPAYLYIDDRALRFQGDYTKLEEEIHNFKPWYKS